MNFLITYWSLALSLANSIPPAKKVTRVKLSEFITGHMDQILVAWDEYAQTMTPAADDMSVRGLRNHAEAMLRAIALDIETSQTDAERHDKSIGESDDTEATNAASVHGSMRHDSHFTLVQLNGEFRALRASVLQLWLDHAPGNPREVLADVMRFNEALDQALAESVATFSERTDHARDMFDAILGHDLRGPLATMTMAGDMLIQSEFSPDTVKEVGLRIKRVAHYMTALVSDLLEFARSRLGGDTMPVHPKRVNLADVCSAAIDDAGAMHPDTDFQLVVATPVDAWVDANRMQQLLVNLLGNAGQHGASGRPVQLHLAGNQDAAVLSIINEGTAIPARALKSIFEPMVRLAEQNNAATSVATSLGLGLHIASAIAHAHGGSISVDSDEMHTTFTVHLPSAGKLDR